MNDKLKFYAGTTAFMLSVITIIGCLACFFLDACVCCAGKAS